MSDLSDSRKDKEITRMSIIKNKMNRLNAFFDLSLWIFLASSIEIIGCILSKNFKHQYCRIKFYHFRWILRFERSRTDNDNCCLWQTKDFAGILMIQIRHSADGDIPILAVIRKGLTKQIWRYGLNCFKCTVRIVLQNRKHIAMIRFRISQQKKRPL